MVSLLLRKRDDTRVLGTGNRANRCLGDGNRLELWRHAQAHHVLCCKALEGRKRELLARTSVSAVAKSADERAHVSRVEVRAQDMPLATSAKTRPSGISPRIAQHETR
jgi:hypothetical protein